MNSSSQCRWIPVALPNCRARWSDREDKRFHTYPSLEVFIKIFSPAAYHQFETEVKIFNCLSEIQGKGIPKLYGSGKISGSNEFCLVMSHDGEQLKEWTDESR